MDCKNKNKILSRALFELLNHWIAMIVNLLTFFSI